MPKLFGRLSRRVALATAPGQPGAGQTATGAAAAVFLHLPQDEIEQLEMPAVHKPASSSTWSTLLEWIRSDNTVAAFAELMSRSPNAASLLELQGSDDELVGFGHASRRLGSVPRSVASLPSLLRRGLDQLLQLDLDSQFLAVASGPEQLKELLRAYFQAWALQISHCTAGRRPPSAFRFGASSAGASLGRRGQLPVPQRTTTAAPRTSTAVRAAAQLPRRPPSHRQRRNAAEPCQLRAGGQRLSSAAPGLAVVGAETRSGPATAGPALA